MKRLLLFFAFFATITTAFSQQYFSDTPQLNQYIRDTIKDRRPDKVTAAQLQKAFLGTTYFLKMQPNFGRGLKNFGTSVGLSDSMFQKLYLNDAITTYNFIPTIKTDSAGWVRNSVYAANVTETVVTDGLQIASAYTGAYDESNTVVTTFESCLDDIETVARFRIVSLGLSPVIGIYYGGATDLFSTSQLQGFNLFDGSVNTGWYNSGYQFRAYSGITFSPGDIVEISYRRLFHFMYHTITNITTGKSYMWYDDGTAIGGTAWVTDVYPGLYVEGGTYVLQSFKVFGRGANADLMVMGSSVIQTQNGNSSFDSSAVKRANDLSGIKIVGAAKSANKLQDLYQALPEIKAMKPKAVAIEAGHNNLLAGEGVATYGPYYHKIVDSLIAWGITPVCIRPTPTTWVDITQINSFIDSAFGHNPNVKILNLWNTTPLYNTSYPSNKDPQYYIDNSHLNAAGSRVLGIGLANQVKHLKLIKPLEWTINNVDADYSLPFSVYKVKLKATLTANRTLTLPPAASNSFAVLTIANFNTGSFNWSVNQSIRRADGTTITQLVNGKIYTISVVDGEYFIEKE